MIGWVSEGTPFPQVQRSFSKFMLVDKAKKRLFRRVGKQKKQTKKHWKESKECFTYWIFLVWCKTNRNRILIIDDLLSFMAFCWMIWSQILILQDLDLSSPNGWMTWKTAKEIQSCWALGTCGGRSSSVSERSPSRRPMGDFFNSFFWASCSCYMVTICVDFLGCCLFFVSLNCKWKFNIIHPQWTDEISWDCIRYTTRLDESSNPLCHQRVSLPRSEGKSFPRWVGGHNPSRTSWDGNRNTINFKNRKALDFVHQESMNLLHELALYQLETEFWESLWTKHVLRTS